MASELIATDQIAGTAKKLSLELEKLPLQSHAAVISIMNILCEHRQQNLKAEHAAQQQAMYELQVDRARKEQERQDAKIVQPFAVS